MNFDLREAQLFRLLCDLFGTERVFPKLSVAVVCEGDVPQLCSKRFPDLDSWASSNTCLFTIVDEGDQPRMVVEFFSGFSESIDAEEAEHQQYLKPILHARGIHYVTVDDDEFSELLHPDADFGMVQLLEAKLGIAVGA